MRFIQQLTRNLGLMSMIGMGFAVSSCWTAMGGTFQNAFNAGGPVTLSFGWIGVTLCALCVAGSLAEMCSSMPTNGGQFSWTGMLSSEKWAPITVKNPQALRALCNAGRMLMASI